MVLENEIRRLERQINDLTALFVTWDRIKSAIDTLEDLCVGYCECCNSFYDNSDVNFCEECCVGCQGKDHSDIAYYCDDCREEINGAVEEMNAIIRGDYI